MINQKSNLKNQKHNSNIKNEFKEHRFDFLFVFLIFAF